MRHWTRVACTLLTLTSPAGFAAADPKVHETVLLELEKQPEIQIWVFLDGKDELDGAEARQRVAGLLSARALERRRLRRTSTGLFGERDLPLSERAVREVEAIAGAARIRSRWLNALGVRADRQQIEALAELTSEYAAEEDMFVAGLEFIEANGGDVATSSLVIRNLYTQSQLDGPTSVMSLGFRAAADNGIHCFQGAGNDTHDANPGTSHLSAPDDAIDITAVGTVDLNGVHHPGPSRLDGRGDAPGALLTAPLTSSPTARPTRCSSGGTAFSMRSAQRRGRTSP